MIDTMINRKHTKRLLQASKGMRNISKLRLDWLLNDNRICGCLKYDFFGRIKDVFLLQKVDEDYRLIYDGGKGTHIYAILDIEEFLQFVGVDEWIGEDISLLIDGLKQLEDINPTGQIEIHDDRIFVLDFLYEDIDESA